MTGGALATNPRGASVWRAAAAAAIGPVTINVHRVSVGGVFVRTDIHHLDHMQLVVPHVPHRHIGWSAFLEVTMVACRSEFAIVGPRTAYRSLLFKLA
jgi:hypothetical protein